jgi:hypothetical protein
MRGEGCVAAMILFYRQIPPTFSFTCTFVRPEPMKRFTIDVPAELHRRVKLECARRGTNVADDEREFPKS